jgi:hypothetical protein
MNHICRHLLEDAHSVRDAVYSSNSFAVVNCYSILGQGIRLRRAFLLFFFFGFRERVSLCSPGCPGTHFVDQAGLELRNPPTSASQSAGIKGVHHHAHLFLPLLIAACFTVWKSYVDLNNIG